jgi:hypothetical protein
MTSTGPITQREDRSAGFAGIGLPVIDQTEGGCDGRCDWPRGCRRAGWGEWAGGAVAVKDATSRLRALPVYGRCAGIGWMRGPRPAAATVRS